MGKNEFQTFESNHKAFIGNENNFIMVPVLFLLQVF